MYTNLVLADEAALTASSLHPLPETGAISLAKCAPRDPNDCCVLLSWLGGHHALSSMKSLPLPCVLPPGSQVMAVTCCCPAILLLLWAPLHSSWHVALMGHHCGHASALQLPSGVRAGTLTHHPRTVLILQLTAWGPSHCSTMSSQGPVDAAVASTPVGVAVVTLNALVLLMICTCLLRHQYHCSRKHTCAPRPRHYAGSVRLTPGPWVIAYQIRCQEEPPWLLLPPTGKIKRTGRPQHHLRIPGALATTAIHSPSYSWPKRLLQSVPSDLSWWKCTEATLLCQEEGMCPQMCRRKCKAIRNTTKQGNVALPNSFPGTASKETEASELLEKEFSGKRKVI